MDYSRTTLGELLSSTDTTIRRNAFSILKQLQRQRDAEQARILRDTRCLCTAARYFEQCPVHGRKKKHADSPRS